MPLKYPGITIFAICRCIQAKSLNVCKLGFMFKNQSTSLQPRKGTGLFKPEYFMSSHSSAFSPLFAGLFLMELFLQLPKRQRSCMLKKVNPAARVLRSPAARDPKQNHRSGKAQLDNKTDFCILLKQQQQKNPIKTGYQLT